MKVKLEIGKKYISRNREIVYIFERASHEYFPFKGRYEDGREDTFTEDGRYTKSGVHEKDLISCLDEKSRMYHFFASKHSGTLSDKWKEFEE